MRLLVVTQAVDKDDAALGFFHGWLEVFSAQYAHIEVICLKEGKHALPKNVRVHSLGKEHARSRFRYTVRFYMYLWNLRKEYDAVFVHMNEEYVLLGGLVWRICGTRVVLWRNHKIGSILTKVACLLANTVCFTSPDAYIAAYKKAVQMPIGIDTQQFSIAKALPSRASILFFGRLDRVKRPDLFIDALNILASHNIPFTATVCGSPSYPNDPYAAGLAAQGKELVHAGKLTLVSAIRHEQSPALYRAHALYVNLTPSGSFDKTIGEAMASGCVVLAANGAVREVLGDLYINELTPDAVARALARAVSFSDVEQKERAITLRSYVESQHSLSLLSQRLFGILTA